MPPVSLSSLTIRSGLVCKSIRIARCRSTVGCQWKFRESCTRCGGGRAGHTVSPSLRALPLFAGLLLYEWFIIRKDDRRLICRDVAFYFFSLSLFLSFSSFLSRYPSFFFFTCNEISGPLPRTYDQASTYSRIPSN